MIKIGVIGYGYWGPNLVRNFSDLSESEVVAVSDVRPERLTLAKNRYPNLNVYADYHALINDTNVDAVAIATPVSSHFELVMKSLLAGKHVLVEKPLASSTTEALQLVEQSEKSKKVLMVDHTFVYTGAVRKIKEIIDQNIIGRLYYFDSQRINLGLFQHDVNVLWDLAVHDLSIMDFLIQKRPYAVAATGMAHITGQPENVAYLTCFFDDNLIAHFHVNWLAPVKLRRILIGGSQKMIVYDDLEPAEKIKVYDKGITINSNPEKMYQLMLGYRTGDIWSPQVDGTEALRVLAKHFLQCIMTRQQPLTDGEVGLRVVSILEAATRSMN